MARPPLTVWPPLITSASQPAWMPWRDRALTLLMWIVFAVLLETEAELTVAHGIALFRGGESSVPPNWDEFVAALTPFVKVIAGLFVWLAAFGLVTMRRRRRTALLPQPMPLEDALEAGRGGMDVAGLHAARLLHLSVVHIDGAGHYRVEAHGPMRRAIAADGRPTGS